MNIQDLISQPLFFGLDMDSDDVEAALEAIAIWQMRPRAGAPRGNTNRAVPDPRNHIVKFRVNDEELALLEQGAGGESVGVWVRDVALSAAKQTKE